MFEQVVQFVEEFVYVCLSGCSFEFLLISSLL